jgi:hypothetical protein
MSPRGSARSGHKVYQGLGMMLAQQRVADLRRAAERAQAPCGVHPAPGPVKRLARSSRLANGAWLYGRRDSA